MKPAARKSNLVIVVTVLVFACVFATRASAATRALLAWGAGESFWSVDVNPQVPVATPPNVITTIRLRQAGDVQWHTSGELSETPASISNRGSELLVVLDDGQWKIVSTSDVRSGLALPATAKVLALAGDGDDIWAIGGYGNPASATKPATTGKSSATTPATAASQSKPATSSPANPNRPLALFRLQKGSWSEMGEIPLDFRTDQIAAVSLAMLDAKLTLAIVGPDRAVRLFTRTGDHWDRGIDVATLGEGAQLKLLDVLGRPALWIADPNSAGSLYFASEKWTHPVKLVPSQRLEGFDQRSLAFALGQLRLIATNGKGTIAEQLYQADGTLLGEASRTMTAPTAMQKRVGDVMKVIVMAALVAWMLGSLRQRPNLAEIIKRIDTLNVAPLERRFIGGAIDAVPLFVGLIASYIFSRQNDQPPTGIVNFASPEFISVYLGVGLYFLHVTLAELLGARSIGKLLTGTRVVSIDGTPAAASQILARNALRLIDLILMGIPLLSTVQSPLRQRVGDMMAATIVVNVAPPKIEVPEKTPPESESKD